MASVNDCVTCDAGTSCPVGSSSALPCLPGSFGPSPGLATCSLCPAGTFTSDSGSTACRNCTAGYLCVEGSSAPQPCPGGTHGDQSVLATIGYLTNLTTDCIICPAGTSCTVGSGQPTPCAPGSFTNAPGQSECFNCEPGKFQSESGQARCAVCGAGNYSANILSCEPCQIGEFCIQGAVVGERCPSGFTTAGRGAASAEDCGCFAGLYEAISPQGNRSCLACPSGTACNKADTRLAALPVTPTYWRQGNMSVDVRRCFTAAACLGGTNVTNQCASGQRGPYCALCADGYFGGSDGELCKQCDGSSLLTFLPAIIIGGIVLLLFLYVLFSCVCGGQDRATPRPKQNESIELKLKKQEQKMKRDAQRRCPCLFRCYERVRGLMRKAGGLGVKFRILVALFQMLDGIAIAFSIQYPPIYQEALRYIGSIVQIDLPKAMPLGCVIQVSFFQSLLMRTALPLFVMIVLVLAGKCFKRCDKPDLASICSTGWFILLFLVYPSCSSAVFQAFICDTLEDGTQMLRVDYAVTCWQEDHLRTVAYAALMAVVYPIGTPCLYAAMLYANRDELERIKRLEMVAEAERMSYMQRMQSRNPLRRQGLDASIAQRENDAAWKHRMQLPTELRKLTAGYDMRCYWFEVSRDARTRTGAPKRTCSHSHECRWCVSADFRVRAQDLSRRATRTAANGLGGAADLRSVGVLHLSDGLCELRTVCQPA